jgi:broad specificity phosphatase PhoE
VASPMRRTLYTCLLSFEPAVKAGKKVIALQEIQEVSCLPCDTGSSTEKLAAEFDASQTDLSLIQPGWNDKGRNGPWAPDMHKLEARAKKARNFFRTLGSQVKDGDAHIVAVTHGGFLHFLTQDWDGMDIEKGRSRNRGPPSETCCRSSARLTTNFVKFSRHRMGQYRMQVVRVRRPQRARPGCQPQGDERQLEETTRQRKGPDGDRAARASCRRGGIDGAGVRREGGHGVKTTGLTGSPGSNNVAKETIVVSNPGTGGKRLHGVSSW